MKKQSFRQGFTIVELLVVIVVIGILAAITIISYTGISKKATASSLQSDLAGASKQLKLYQVDNGKFPTSLTETPSGSGNYCPEPADLRYCFKISSGNTYTYTNPTPQTFKLTENNITASLAYEITESTQPTEVVAVVSPGPNWIAGLSSTPLQGKFVYNRDINNTDGPYNTVYLAYKTTNTAVSSPQGATGLDPDYMSYMSLVSSNLVDFSLYPARNACKSLGDNSRLPNTQELTAIYAGRASYGGNFQSFLYWTSSEGPLNTDAVGVDFTFGNTSGDYKSTTVLVRCVSD